LLHAGFGSSVELNDPRTFYVQLSEMEEDQQVIFSLEPVKLFQDEPRLSIAKGDLEQTFITGGLFVLTGSQNPGGDLHQYP
jgi:hypothetical protein